MDNNQEQHIKQFTKDTQSVSLSAQEKIALRREFDLFMSKKRGRAYRWFSFAHTVGYVCLVVLLVAGGISYTAEAALPGDVLYPIKRNVNEKVVEAFSVSPESKTRLEITFTERRLEEALYLIAEHRLEESHVDAIQKEIEDSSSNISNFVDRAIEQGDVAGAVEIVSDFKTVLQAHETILEYASNKETEQNSEVIESLSDEVQETKNDVLSETEDIKSGLENISLEDSEENLSDAQEALEELTVADSPVTVDTIKGLIEAGKEKIKEGDYNAAFLVLEEAEQLSKESSIVSELQEVFEESE